MTLKTDLEGQVKDAFRQPWDVQKTNNVPAPQDLRLNANHAKDLETATILYADLDGSTTMVDGQQWQFSAEVYKTFLRCASQVLRSEGGIITSYDGDRVMAVFTGDSKNTSAVRAAMKIHYAVVKIIQPALDAQYPNSGFQVSHVVGVDTSQMRAARIGVHGDNDIVWVGRAANYAAKLTALSGAQTWITKAVYENMNESVKTSSNGVPMWEARSWVNMNNQIVYRSIWWWSID